MKSDFILNSDLEDLPCPMGCNREDQLVFKASDRLHGLPGVFSVVKCKSCGLMRTNPRPSQEAIAAYYPASYGPHLYTRVADRSRHLRQPSSTLDRMKVLLKKIFPLYSDILPELLPGRMLEIGCASGAFMHQMQCKGWEVQGIETSSIASERARRAGLEVYTGSPETAPDPSRPFDLVVAWMVMEHLHNPLQTLKRIYRWTTPGGWLVFSVPNAGSLDFRFFKHRWYALQVPTHLFHFTPCTVKMMLEASGWQLERIFHQRVLSNYFASSAYLLRDMGGPEFFTSLLGRYPEKAGLLHYIFYPFAWGLSLWGQTGRMTVWARKVKR